jgi:SAM-dependent methyltransferase
MLAEKIQLIEEAVCCPDCLTKIKYTDSAFTCTQCNRQFPYKDGILEMLPAAPINYAFDKRSGHHEGIYKRLFHTKREEANLEKSWATPELVPTKWLRTKMGHVNFIKGLIEKNTSSRHLFCDFSGGSGYYTFEFYKLFRWIFHCDLSIESMLYTKKKADEKGIDNIIFIRTDYTRPPFNGSLDIVFCGDSLIYSPFHEGLVVKGIHQAVKPDGHAIFDFHNWWHNPLRRLGLMSNPFGECYSYSKKQTDDMVSHLFPTFTYHKYYQEFANGQRASIIPSFFPGTRHTYVAQK